MLNLLAKPLAGYVGAATSLALAIALAVMSILYRHELARADGLAGKLAQSQDAVHALQTAVHEQNDAVDALAKAAQASALAAKASQERAQVAAAESLARADLILAAKANGDPCAAASDLIRRTIAEERK